MSYKIYLDTVQFSISSDSCNFWSYIRTKKTTSRIPGKMEYEGNYFDCPQNIVNAFGLFFQSVYLPKSDNPNIADVDVTVQNSCSINIDSVTDIEIQKATTKLKNKMTSGLDLIPSFLVKDCSNVLSVPLLIIFNLALKTQTFPDIWKRAKICPVFKAGDSSIVSNYRAIAILSNFAKVFEIIIYERIYLSVNNRLSLYQHGFISHRSTITNLTIFTQFISHVIDESGQVDVIYTDFSKAFDRIDHAILFSKLRTWGLCDSLLSFIQSYLSNREQFVSYNGYNSTSFIATSGVPQGSNLGPLLFLLFIDDITSVISNSSKLLFADDLKLYKKITCSDDCALLQNDIDKVHIWCVSNRLHLNASKCKVVTFTRKHSTIDNVYSIDGMLLSRSNSTKDLGVIFDSQLTFIDHINLKVKEATKMLGFIIRNCKSFTNIRALKILYFSYVRSKLEYASLIWYPYYMNQKLALENVQRKFLKFLAFKVDAIYPERGIEQDTLLTRFEMNSLELRRKCNSISFLYNLLHNNIDCPELLSQLCFNIPIYNSRQNYTFYCPHARSNLLLKSPIYTMCSNFNQICHMCDINNGTKNVILHTAVNHL